MTRAVGTVVRGLRSPIINEGDDIEQITVETVLEAAKAEGYTIEDRDIISITESIVARAQGNYASIDAIATDIKTKFEKGTIGVIFPILSRNRFSTLLQAIARGSKKIVLMLSYPSDEVGNHLVDIEDLDNKGINPWTDVLSEADFRKHFGIIEHAFTGVDYIEKKNY